MDKFVLTSILLCLFFTDALAQKTRRSSESEGVQFDTKLDSRGRIDLRSGLVRARYGQQRFKTYTDPEHFLKEESVQFGWNRNIDDLDLISDKRRSASRHLTYQQTFAGLPVDAHQVRVNMDSDGRVSMVLSAFVPVNAEERSFNTQPAISSSEAMSRARNELAPNGGQVSAAELIISNPATPILAWKLFVWPLDEPAEYRVLVDAQTGEVVEAFDQALSSGRHAGESRKRKTDPEDDSVATQRVDGTGLVYDPGPLFQAGAPYGAPYVDDNDATNAALDAARIQVTLLDISQNGNGDFVLEGPYARIVGRNSSGSQVYTPQVESTADGFQYDRSEDGFEAVMAYYHIDKSQRYVQSLGITDLWSGGIDVNPRGIAADESYFYPTQQLVLLGLGGVDDAEDPSVIWHEYAHALLDTAVPQLLGSREGGALHEGFSDYWAASYTRSLVESGQTSRNDWRRVFLWDSGEGSIWSGRFLDHQGIYPQDICVANMSPGACNIHDDGRMWATTLMEVYDRLGRLATDELVLLSHNYLNSSATFADAAQAVIQADLDYNGGVNTPNLIGVFAPRGLIDAAQFGPIIVHDQLPSTEIVGVPITVTADVFGLSAAVSEVQLVYESNTIASTTVALSRTIEDQYSGQLLLPTVVDSVSYYIRAVDTDGTESFAPAGAPAEVYSFMVGDDTTSPVVTHEPLASAEFLEWPASISGIATDNLGIDLVRAEYAVFDAAENEMSSGSFDIASSQGAFTGAFPVALGEIEDGGRIEYSLLVVDGSLRENSTRLPETGRFSFDILAGNVLQYHDFGDLPHSIVIDGQWSAGDPEYGVLASRFGTGALATVLNGPYSSSAGISSVVLPAINLAGLDQSYLRLWHYFDTEHEGMADPAASGASLLDGGVLRYRTEAMPTWQPLVPVGGYPGTLSTGSQNPLAGMDAFGGFSYGWRWEEFALPRTNGVEIRFDFATNTGNNASSERYAGWIIDSIEITTLEPNDAQSPTILEEPASVRVLSFDGPIPEVRLIAVDDLGVVDAILEWTYETRSPVQEGTLRMTQAADDHSLFIAYLDFALAPEPGNRISYRIRVTDPAGHEVTVPGVDSYSIEYRLFGEENALTSIWASGSWTLSDDIWRVRGTSFQPVSGLNLDARDVEINAESAFLRMEHEYQFGSRMAGVLEISVNQGDSWRSLIPLEGYTGTASLGSGHPLSGNEAFTGSSGGRRVSTFDLQPYSGEQVLIRILAGSSLNARSSDVCTIHTLSFEAETAELQFSVDSSFELLPNYPNPFSDRTQIAVSVAQSQNASLRVYDALGREVAVLVDGVLDEGSHTFTFEARSLAGGVYFVRFRAGGKEKSRTLLHIGSR